MCITTEEKNYLISEICTLLDEYDYNWEYYAVEKAVDTWAYNKADLIQLFKKHPNYVEGKFMIAFDTDYEREINVDAINNFSFWLRDNRRELICPSEIKDEIESSFDLFLPKGIYWFICYLSDNDMKCRTITKEIAEWFEREIPNAHIHEGAKTTRAINKMCCYLGYNKLPDYNKEFAKYADALNPLKITRHTVLSINPIDYLTMSFGNSWSSCHTIDKGNKRNMPYGYQGQYSSGTMSYMLDAPSMVFYTVDANYNGNEYYSQPKITRQMFHYGEEKLIQSRLYPQNNDGAREVYTQYRNIVQQIMADILEVPNYWTLKHGSDNASEYIEGEGTHYEDYKFVNDCTISRLKGSENENWIYVGHNPICPECGNEHENAESISCCASAWYCEDCGAVIHNEDDIYWVDGAMYCRDCVSCCNYCEEYHRRNDEYVENYGYVCDCCLMENFIYCEDCNKWFNIDDATYVEDLQRFVCDNCYAELCEECHECGEVHLKDNMNLYEGNYYCDDCWDDVEII